MALKHKHGLRHIKTLYSKAHATSFASRHPKMMAVIHNRMASAKRKIAIKQTRFSFGGSGYKTPKYNP